MNYASMDLADEITRLHPETYALVLAFELWSKKHNLPPVFITDISRKLSWYQENGQPPNSSSWHLYNCAVDLRVAHYTPEEREMAIDWLERRCSDRVTWELITRMHGTGPHLHVARRDHEWKAKFKEKNP